MNATLSQANQEASRTESDPRWQAVVDRDGLFDGSFYYSVRTTGVYCRPSCGARLPKPENVRFHETREEAERAGFRPCRRCKPDELTLRQRQADRITEACRAMESGDGIPSLETLAKGAGMSPHHFHRLFKTITGVTPKAYAVAHRTKRVQEELTRGGASVSETIYEAGFNSSGRFYEAADGMLGMTPSSYKAGGKDAEIRFAVGECSLGSILVAQSDRGICAILMGDDPEGLVRDLQDRFPKADLIGGDQEFESLVAKVVGLVERPAQGLELPLDVRGTAFQQRVWQALREIPVGATATYAEIARRIGEPKSVRAVAQACGANALAVAIPCHRVVKSDGSLSGYRWGVERKRELLRKESAA
ncbi:MAG: bifunctional DNA-binding transcriptional regulator/O6-methylguanine-DNA methyltransferase Ada [Fimbriimonas sp.]